MPLYDFVCSSFGQDTDHQCSVADRLSKIDCTYCEELDVCELVVGYNGRAPQYGGETVAQHKRVIHDEREVIAERGVNWLDKGTTGLEGGAGKKQYF